MQGSKTKQNKKQNKNKTRGCGLAICINMYLKTKRRIMETQNIISPCKNIIFQKSLKKKPKSPSRYYNSIITNLKGFNTSKPKISSFKNPHIKIDLLLLLLLLLPRGQNPLSYYYIYTIMNLKHNKNILALVSKANNKNL